jgi:hypothetical protein
MDCRSKLYEQPEQEITRMGVANRDSAVRRSNVNNVKTNSIGFWKLMIVYQQHSKATEIKRAEDIVYCLVIEWLEGWVIMVVRVQESGPSIL